MCDVPERSELTDYSIGINVRRRKHLVSRAIWKGVFPSFSLTIYNIWQFADFLARAVKVMKILVAVRTNAIVEIPYHALIDKTYIVVRTGNDDSILHSFQYSEKFIPFVLKQSLESDLFFKIPVRTPIVPAATVKSTILSNGSGKGETKKARGKKIIRVTRVTITAPLTLAV